MRKEPKTPRDQKRPARLGDHHMTALVRRCTRMFRQRFTWFTLLLVLLLVVVVAAVGAQSEGRVVTSQGTFTSLAEALALAEEGDTVEVYGGVFAGPLVLEKPVKLVGYDWPVIDGGGRGTVVKIAAPDTALNGFFIKNSGDVLAEENSGIAVEAPGAILENKRSRPRPRRARPGAQRGATQSRATARARGRRRRRRRRCHCRRCRRC